MRPTSPNLAILAAALAGCLGCSGVEQSSQKPGITAAEQPPSSGSGPAAAGGSEAGGSTGSETGGASVSAPAPTPAVVSGELTAVLESDGCGTPYAGRTGSTKNTLETAGTKDADCAASVNGEPRCGEWSTPRDYYVYLPENYDPTKPYSLVLLGPGCGGNGTNIYSLNDNVDGSVIRVGLTPGPSSLGHGTNPNQGCFDDREGDDSIDWVFYEKLYDRLNADLCFDRHRVFAGGVSTGASLANQLGCKYAGDPIRPIRGIFATRGGFPTDPQHLPTCSSAPLAGMWIHEVNDTTIPFESVQIAMTRAMSHDECKMGDSYQTASFESFPIGGGQADTTCKRILGCSLLYPLVVCPLAGHGRTSHDQVVNPGVATFFRSFQTAPLLTE